MSSLTDHALATIASILDLRSSDQPATASPPIAPVDAEGYTKMGPGPMDAVRFRWTVRRGDNDEYFVDETIGGHSAPVVIGPMNSDAAMKLVDERESDARQRFEQIRSEMIGRVAALAAASRGSDA